MAKDKQTQPIQPTNQLQNPDTMVSLFLGIAVVVVAGVLIVNYFQNKKGSINGPGTGTENTEVITGTPGVTGLPTTHTVVAGETLWSISEKYYKSGYNYVDIVSENKLASANAVEVGQKLSIPNVAVRSVDTTIAPTVDATVAPTPTIDTTSKEVEVKNKPGTKYTVKAGDSLWNISVATYGNGYRWTDIWNANKGVVKDPNLIYPGNELSLP